MDTHNKIIMILDSFENFRDPADKGDGLCFGVTLSILLSLFSGNIKGYYDAINAMHRLFPDADENKIKERINELNLLLTQRIKSTSQSKTSEDYVNILALLTYISITQSPLFYTEYVQTTNKPDMEFQHSNINAVANFLLFQSDPRKTTCTMFPQKGYSIICSLEMLKHFFDELSPKVIERQKYFGILFSHITHTVGCGYNPDEKCWIITGNIHTFLADRIQSTNDLAEALWRELFGNPDSFHAIYIQTLDSVKNANIHRNAINNIREINTDLLTLEIPGITCEYYTLAYNINDPRALSEIETTRMMTLDKSDYQKNIQSLSGIRNFDLEKSIELEWNEVTLGLIYYGNDIDINKKNIHGDTPLHCLVKSGNMSLAEALLSIKNPNVFIEDNLGRTPMYYAIIDNNEDIIKMLFKLMAKSTSITTAFVASNTKYTLLHMAASHGLRDIVEKLLDLDSDPNLKSIGGLTPLQLAAIQGHDNVVEVLLKNGKVNIDAVCENGMDARGYAFRHSKTSIFNMIESVKKDTATTKRVFFSIDQNQNVSENQNQNKKYKSCK